MYKNFQKRRKTRKITTETTKNRQKPSKYLPKYRKTVKPAEKSLKTAKNVEKAKKIWQTKKIASKMSEKRENSKKN